MSEPLTLITGGSEGIGLAIAMERAGRGELLLLVARRADRLAEARREILTLHPSARVEILPLDLLAPDFLAVIDDRLLRLNAHVAVLVNSAASGHCGAFHAAPPERLSEVLRLSMEVPAMLMRHVLPGMTGRGSGTIFNIASLGGYVPGPYQAAYYASKAGLLSLSAAIAAEVAEFGISVIALAPGPVETHFHHKMGAERALYRALIPSTSPASVARWARWTERRRLRAAPTGAVALALFPAVRYLPHCLILPILKWLLRPR